MEIEWASVEKLQGDARDYLKTKKKKQKGANMVDIPVSRALARVSENLVESSRSEKETALDLHPNMNGNKGSLLSNSKTEAVHSLSSNKNHEEQGLATKDILFPNTFEALLGKEKHQSSSDSPKRQIAHPELANILMQQQVVSLVCPVPFLNPLIVTMNTSAFEIPTQSMDSFGEKHDDSGKQLIPTENDQDFDKIVASTTAHSRNKVETKSDQNVVRVSRVGWIW
ncbi:hypothetical protein K7X08_037702 [Anisodus acutangulus]|uniref:Uncharacterized protein n=1 Tax=Anisodus acutangulus TaxID=402998 RepID=A0A9Q1MXL9_9SOLA|nr:hypothetical protein K7X08_037702 [Anisodus acutangulus]